MYNDHDTLKDENEEGSLAGGFSLFMCGAIKDKGTELKSFFKPPSSKVQECYEKNETRKRGAQKTIKPSLMANQERKFVNTSSQSKSFLGFKLNWFFSQIGNYWFKNLDDWLINLH